MTACVWEETCFYCSCDPLRSQTTTELQRVQFSSDIWSCPCYLCQQLTVPYSRVTSDERLSSECVISEQKSSFLGENKEVPCASLHGVWWPCYGVTLPEHKEHVKSCQQELGTTEVTVEDKNGWRRRRTSRSVCLDYWNLVCYQARTHQPAVLHGQSLRARVVIAVRWQSQWDGGNVISST
jgi:hypothetical protein